MGFMPGLTITTRVSPDAGTNSPIGSSGTAGDVGAPDAETPQNAPSPTRPPVSPITPTQESARLSGPDGHGDGPIYDEQAHRHRHRQQHTTFSSSASTSSHSLTSPFTSTNNNGNNNNNNNNIPSFARGRPTFTHSQVDQVGIPPPPPQPIAFDDNPDVLALKSAITILQLQRQRATADIQALNRAKAAALSDPGAFVADLAAGRIGMDGDPLLNGPGFTGDCSSDDDDDDEDGDEDGDEDMNSEGDSVDGEDDGEDDGAEVPSSSESPHDPDGDVSMSSAGAGNALSTSTLNCLSKTWRSLPKPQTVVRCPPINWAQYAIVGESLDKLHREQLTAPTLGAPAVLSVGGVYEFKGTAAGAGAAPGGGVVSVGNGGGYAMGDTTATTDRTSTPPTTTMAATAGTEAQQSPGETLGQGQGKGQGQGQFPTLGRNEQPQRLVGIAAPYTPGRDKIERTTGRKGAKR
ncbi:hypothetical protein QR685DRAFT_445642 [Neurospora intermedia]|uniref:Uncharacterized protein n=1 Tax=Neurospora intermedia TaxID=5142 RepID=A0ABR3DA26_NEUIN